MHMMATWYSTNMTVSCVPWHTAHATVFVIILHLPTNSLHFYGASVIIHC